MGSLFSLCAADGETPTEPPVATDVATEPPAATEVATEPPVTGTQAPIDATAVLKMPLLPQRRL